MADFQVVEGFSFSLLLFFSGGGMMIGERIRWRISKYHGECGSHLMVSERIGGQMRILMCSTARETVTVGWCFSSWWYDNIISFSPSCFQMSKANPYEIKSGTWKKYFWDRLAMTSDPLLLVPGIEASTPPVHNSRFRIQPHSCTPETPPALAQHWPNI
jgi:hypothetical protein